MDTARKELHVKTHRIQSIAVLAGCALILASGLTLAGQNNTTKEAKKMSTSVVKPMDIVDTAVAAGSFKTLAAALNAAGLVETLKGKGPFTVFAPTDEAFAKLPAGTIDTLLKPENKEKLAAILTYHVVAGNVMAKDVVALKEAKTVNGQSLTIAVKDGVVMVDQARVVKTDIEATNGVIHVIDSVVLPK